MTPATNSRKAVVGAGSPGSATAPVVYIDPGFLLFLCEWILASPSFQEKSENTKT